MRVVSEKEFERFSPESESPMSKEIRAFLIDNKDRLFDSCNCKLCNITEAATQFCSERNIEVDREIVMLFGIEVHAVRALDLV